MMKKTLQIGAFLLSVTSVLYGQNGTPTTVKTVDLQEVIITANKLPVLLRKNPGAMSVVTTDMLSIMPKSIGVEEALRLVPGVRIDNQHDGERVHLSIRGQGILTERG